MEQIFRKYLGNDVIFFTTDGAGDGYLKCGATKTLYTTVDFGAGGDPKNSFLIQRKYQPQGPFVSNVLFNIFLKFFLPNASFFFFLFFWCDSFVKCYWLNDLISNVI